MPDTNSSHYHGPNDNQGITPPHLRNLGNLPNDNELEELVWGLNPYLESDDGSDRASRHLENTKAISALNAYFLSQALEILGDDETVESSFASVKKAETPVQHVRNQLRAELRKAFQSKYAPKEGQ